MPINILNNQINSLKKMYVNNEKGIQIIPQTLNKFNNIAVSYLFND